MSTTASTTPLDAGVEIDAEGLLHTGAPIGFALAARAGDLAAIQAAADWFRERGLSAHPTDDRFPSDEWKAYCVEVYKGQMDEVHSRARLIRALLSKLPESVKKPKGARGRRPGRGAFQDFFARLGLPVRTYNPGYVQLPTDHLQEQETRDALVSLYAAHFRGDKLQVEFDDFSAGVLQLHPAYDGYNWLMRETFTDD